MVIGSTGLGQREERLHGARRRWLPASVVLAGVEEGGDGHVAPVWVGVGHGDVVGGGVQVLSDRCACVR